MNINRLLQLYGAPAGRYDYEGTIYPHIPTKTIYVGYEEELNVYLSKFKHLDQISEGGVTYVRLDGLKVLCYHDIVTLDPKWIEKLHKIGWDNIPVQRIKSIRDRKIKFLPVTYLKLDVLPDKLKVTPNMVIPDELSYLYPKNLTESQLNGIREKGKYSVFYSKVKWIWRLRGLLI